MIISLPNLRAKCCTQHFALNDGCRGQPLPREVWNPRWVPHSIKFLSPQVAISRPHLTYSGFDIIQSLPLR
jgi:hypothetical protein